MVWPDVSMLGADNLRKVAGYDFHLLRKKYDVQSMWGDLDPQWRLLKSQLETKGPAAFYKQVESASSWHERCTAYWWRPCGVAGLDYYTEPALAVTPTCSTLGVSGWTRDFPWHVYPSPGGRTNNFPSIYPQSGGCIYEETKEEEAGWRQCPDWVATMLRVIDTSVGGVMLRQGRASNLWLKCIWSLRHLAYCTWRGLHCSVWHLFIGSWSARIVPLQAHLDDMLVGPTR